MIGKADDTVVPAGRPRGTKLAMILAILVTLVPSKALPAAPAVSSGKSTETATAAVNLLLDPGFETLESGTKKVWVMTQHAGEKSYEISAKNGVVTLERTGAESWGQVSQRLSAIPLRGKVLEFTAEVRGRFTRSEDTIGSPSGIGFQLKGPKPGMPMGLGAAILATEYAEPGLSPENQEWTVQAIRIEVPNSATSLKLTAMLGRWGQLEVRNPRLVEMAKKP